MELREAIEARRSCRNFSNQAINKKQIEDMIDCARLSPSAANRQNWFYLVVEKEFKEKIAEVMENQLNENGSDIREIEQPTKLYKATRSVVGSIKVIREAPALILVFRMPDENWLEGDYLSIGSAIEHICLRATDLGFGSLWIRDVVFTRKEIAKIVGYPNMELVASIAIGYFKELPYSRRKKELEEIMKWYE